MTPTPPSRPPPEGRALVWFFIISSVVVLVATLGCIVFVSGGNLFSERGAVVVLCGSPTLLLGGLFLWLGVRSLKR